VPRVDVAHRSDSAFLPVNEDSLRQDFSCETDFVISARVK
jgi:hypothetical protein